MQPPPFRIGTRAWGPPPPNLVAAGSAAQAAERKQQAEDSMDRWEHFDRSREPGRMLFARCWRARAAVGPGDGSMGLSPGPTMRFDTSVPNQGKKRSILHK